MVKIMSDTSTLYSIEQGNAKGLLITPLCVTIDNKSYREYEEISPEEFLDIITQGHVPISSQPAFGEVLANYDSTDDELINIAMADGLSGTYENALAAAAQAKNADRITVVNTKTLCGPHRYMVDQAQRLAENGSSKSDILAMLDRLIVSAKSFLIPDDFDYLKRGGRLSPLAANMIGILKVIPVLTQSDDGKKLEPHRVHRKEKAVIADLVNALKKHNVGAGWLVSISHANNLKRAQAFRDALSAALPKIQTEILHLSPSFITQGGPRCVAVQAIEMVGE